MMGEKNVLAILGSPHAKGTTAAMKRTGKVVYANAKNKRELPKRIMKKIERCLK